MDKIKIKELAKKEWVIISAIILLAYLLRILPYLLGYPIPTTEDSLIEFQQITNLIDNNKIDISNDYARFPVLHLMIFGISILGINPLLAFLFFPQIFPCIGLFFFYLFLRRYFPKKYALFACFIIAVFGLNIHWTSQPVRETIGLFFFPLIIYLFDREINPPENMKGKALNKIFLALSFILIIMSHHWSSIMTGFFIFLIAIFSENKNRRYSFLLIFIFLVLNLVYWTYFFPSFFEMAEKVINYWAVFLSLVVILSAVLLRKKGFLLHAKNKRNVWIGLICIIAFVWIVEKFITSFGYPLHIWAGIFLIIFLGFAGFFAVSEKNLEAFEWICAATFFIVLVLGFFSLNTFSVISPSGMVIDPIRFAEFAIFPFSIIASFGFFRIKEKNNIIGVCIVVLMIILGILSYPTAFIFKTNMDETLFYDVRSDVRYIPQEGFEIIDWANSNNYSVISNSYVINEYQRAFYSEKEKKLILISKQDYNIDKKYYLVKDKYLGVDNPQVFINQSKNSELIFSNSWGKLYYSDLYSKTTGKKYVTNYGEKDSSACMSYYIPSEMTAGELYNISIVMKNTGEKNWSVKDNYFLGSTEPDNNIVWSIFARMRFPGEIKPGESINFYFMIRAPREPGIYSSKWRMLKENEYWIGEICGKDNIKVYKSNEIVD